jgi:hypothetical protein
VLGVMELRWTRDSRCCDEPGWWNNLLTKVACSSG